MNGGENNSANPTSYTIESEEIVLQTPNKTGYDFAGWYADEELTEKVEKMSTGSPGNRKFYVKWTPIVYAIEYELNGGENNSLNPTTYTIESEEIVLQTPSKTGYDFVGWYADEALIEKVEKIVTGSFGNKKFYAKWIPTVYAIEYELNGGVNNSANPTTYTIEDTVTLKEPTRENYEFVGWYQNETLTKKIEKIAIGSYGDKRLYAKWLSVYKYSGNEIIGLTDYGKELTILNIPSQIDGNVITSIGYSAFSGCTGLTSVTIDSNVTIIGVYAFRGCTGLISVAIGDSVTSIGDSAFYDCSGLTNITIPNSIKSIGDEAFRSCTGLTSVTIPNSVTSIGYSTFMSCSKLTNITVPNSIKRIGDYAFSGCTGLTSVTIPNSVTSMGDMAFYGCSLTSIYYAGDIASWCRISGLDEIMSSSRTLYIGGKKVEGELIIPDDVTSIGDSAFYGCTGLTSVTIDSNVTSIGGWAFYGCTGLTSVTIPDSVTSIGDSAFYGCKKLVEVIDNSSLNITKGSTNNGYVGCYALNIKQGRATDIVKKDDYLFYTYDGVNYLLSYVGKDTVLALPNNYNGENYRVYEYAFSNCDGLTTVTIGSGVVGIGDNAFSNCNVIESIFVDVNNTVYHSSNNCVIKTQSETLVLGCKNSIIPNDGSVTSIGWYAFKGCARLMGVTIPDCVISIGRYTFEDCVGLASVIIGNSVTTIGYSAFHGCTGLTSVIIPNSVKNIGGYAFRNCTSLKTIYYKGTKEEWDAIEKVSGWDSNTNYTIIYNA